MKSPSQRRAAFAALLLAPTLAACGFNAQTDQVYQPATGVNDRDGNVDVLNALIVSGTDGSGTFAATLVSNEESDDLTGITGEGVTASLRPVDVTAGGVVNLAESGSVSILGDGVKAGNWVSLTLVFSSGQSTSMTVPVVRDDGDYTEVPLPKQTKPGTESTEEPGSEPSDEPTE